MSLKRTIRKRPELDMNPMVDMAFLLVSFFMMTTTFKANLPEDVQIPPSTSEIKLPDSGICTITMGKSGKIYFSIDNKFQRRKLLDQMGELYGVSFNERQKESFARMNGFGVPVTELPALLDARHEQRTYPQTGIPAGNESDELREWLIRARMANPNLRFAVNADMDTPYPTIHQLFETLRDLNITRFNLVTDTKIIYAARP